MDKWVMVVIGWGVVGPILAIGACYVISWGMGIESWRSGCVLSGSRYRRHVAVRRESRSKRAAPGFLICADTNHR